MKKYLATITGALIALSISAFADEKSPPNILLIVSDDLGFNDIGAFGGEIKTPNLDRLAENGVRLSNFHAAPTCSVARAMLFSGTDAHLAGLGNMAEILSPEQLGKRGYEGYLNFDVVSVASLLKDAGYHTYMAGKWHLGMGEDTSPEARGFERSFAMLNGAGSHFNASGSYQSEPKSLYREEGKLVQREAGVYSTTLYTNKILDYIDGAKSDARPFFAYLAYTAPHWPLQAPDEFIKRYQGKYDSGYDVLREDRLKRMKQKGVIIQSATPHPVVSKTKVKWETLSVAERRIESRKMEVYAAMVDNMDFNIGRILNHLKGIGEYDNTFIVFLSDNGPSAHLPKIVRKWAASRFDNSYDNMGRENSFIEYGPFWAQAGSTPFRAYKGLTTEGGVRVPAIISYPKLPKQGSVNDSFASIMDLAPTFLDSAGIEHPGTRYRGRDVHPIKGESMLTNLYGLSRTIHSDEYVMGWELFGNRAIIQGDWKLLRLVKPRENESWQIFNISEDPGETNNLASKNPKKLKEMINLWGLYAKENGVILRP